VGSWGRAIVVPGMAALDKAGGAELVSVPCGSAGNCAADGLYTDASGGQAFVINESNGACGQAINIAALRP
jgi:hypothetical protein